MSPRFTTRLSEMLSAFAVGLVGVSAQAAGVDDAKLAFFEQRIRPVLVEHCYECHSAGSKKLKGGLRLDSKSAVLLGGDTKTSIVPGDASRSLLIESVGYANRDLQMPPKARLPDAAIADLTQWVNDGAIDPRDEKSASKTTALVSTGRVHWAFQAIRTAEPPKKSSLFSRRVHPIDSFVAAKLKEKELSPAPIADRRTLIRRAAYDLTGLPPTPEEIAAFVKDPAKDAFERMIDRLLASPRYGERWGRWWLDVARYADSNGQDENKVMANAWRYRDWVIQSFNANQPFNAFITEQLAGDLLPTNGVSEQAVFDRWTATGLLVMGPKMLAEQDKPKLVMDLVDEQIDVVSRAFLGLTVGCARCHDHKFDPISARDYYALAGIFRSTKTMENLAFVSKFNERRITSASQLAVIAAHDKVLGAKSNEVARAIENADKALRSSWLTNLGTYLASAASSRSTNQSSQPTNLVARLRELMAPDPSTNPVSRTLRGLASDPSTIAGFLANETKLSDTAKGLRLAPGKVGAAFQGNGRNHLELPHSVALEPKQLTVEAWVRFSPFPKDGDQRRWLVSKGANEWAEGHYALMLDRNRAGAYLNIGGGKENVFAVWNEGKPLKANQWHHLAMTYDGVTLRLFVDGAAAGETEIKRTRVAGTGPLVLGRRADAHVNFKGLLDEVYVHRSALTAAQLKDHFENAGKVDGTDVVARWEFNDLADADRELLAVAETHDALFAPGGVFALPKDPRPSYPEQARDAIVALEAARDMAKTNSPAPVAFALAVDEDKPVDLPVHIRGSHLNLAKEPVPRGFVQVAYKPGSSPLPVKSSGRLELAQWLTSPENPLTARVIVNRIWQAHFGEGLVRSPDNFGVRGETPSHPELLDWLAREFMRSGWDVKRLHRLILTSATWRQVGNGGDRESASASEKTDKTHLTAAAIAKGSTVDPDNRLLWHFPRQRLEAEMIRDALLAVSDRLDATAGGSLVSWKNDEYTPTDTVSASSVRRSVYLPVVRDRVFDVFTIFDFANPSVGTAKRIPTVVSHQALFFLNSPLVKESASAFAKNLGAAAPDSATTRIQLAYERAFGRLPTKTEAERAERFIASLPRTEPTKNDEAAWTAWCQMLFAANEFIYRE